MSGPVRRILRRPPVAVPPPLQQHFPPVVARVLAQRQVVDPQELEWRLEGLPGFGALGGIERATELLSAAIQQDRRLLIVGDFDADGATSTAVALRGLGALGARQVDFLVPNRFEYGYGLTPEIVREAITRQPDLIVTVDNGISSIAGVDEARRHGIQVVITDHHLPGEQLPAADAIVNPNLPGDPFPSKALAGVGVIFYLLVALRARLREVGWFAASGRQPPNLAQLLDLVALGTVADLVPLDAVNRILVAQGLARIRAGRTVPGITALLTLSGRRLERITTTDLAFALAPRLNAAGRLDDMAQGIHCLLSQDVIQARQLAVQLDQLNRERRSIEGQMRDEALAILRQLGPEESLPLGICLFDESWHEGVIGILASRVKERLQRPTVIFTRALSGEIKGSARSVPGIHIRDLLDRIAALHPGLLLRFGGHAMAAGLAIEEGRLAQFQQAFADEVAVQAGSGGLDGVIWSDGELAEEEFNLALAEQLRAAAPWGQGFPEPLFDGIFTVRERRIVGERHLKLQLATAGGQLLDAILFNGDLEQLPALGSQVQLAYRLDVNEYRGRSLQLLAEQLSCLP